MPPKTKKASGKVVIYVISGLLMVFMFTYITLLSRMHSQHYDGLMSGLVDFEGGQHSKEFKKLRDRIRVLETKINNYMAYHKDPFLSQRTPAKCEKPMLIKDIACPTDKSCEVDNSMLCMDELPFLPGDDMTPKNDCVVYDFGIRESPDFGLAFAKQCDVVGFDPSPISIEWWKKEKDSILDKYPGYKFSPVGAGGTDGNVVLREYDWGQVSIIEFPYRVIDKTNCTEAGACKFSFHEKQKEFNIPVKTLKTIMKEQDHKRISLLKLDVEGSEYQFLETMIDDHSCKRVDQLVLEWHHYDYDTRYGVTSVPQINVLVALLEEHCGLEQFWIHGSKGWPSNQKQYADMGMTIYYAMSGFKRTKMFGKKETK